VPIPSDVQAYQRSPGRGSVVRPGPGGAGTLRVSAVSLRPGAERHAPAVAALAVSAADADMENVEEVLS
jgi:hypothetical protein